MGKIKDFLKKTFSYVGGLSSTSPVTFVTVCAGTLTAAILTFYWTDVLESDVSAAVTFESVLTQLLVILAVFCCSAFFVESVFRSDRRDGMKSRPDGDMPESTESGAHSASVSAESGPDGEKHSAPIRSKKVLLVAAHIIGAVISIFLGSVVCVEAWDSSADQMLLYDLWESISDSLADGRISSWTFGFCIIMISLGVFFSFRKNSGEGASGSSFSAYLTSVFSKLFFANITYGVLIVGTMTLTGIFTALLWGDFFEIYGAIFALLTGGYLIMRSIACFVEKTEAPNVFISVLIRYALLIMSLAAFVIIYIYMIKIVVLREFPSNSVFEILTSLFVTSMPVAYMAAGLLGGKEESNADDGGVAAEVSGSADDDAIAEAGAVAETGGSSASRTLYNLAAHLPCIFIPFIFLQIYTAGARINQYGLTPKRYMGIAMIVFEIVYIVMYLLFYKKKERRISCILPVIAIFALLCAWMPGINALDLSKTVQISIVRSYLRRAANTVEEPTKKDIRRAQAAYRYVHMVDSGLTKVLFTEDDVKKLEIFENNETVDDGYEYEDSNEAVLTWSSEYVDVDIDISGYDRIRYACLAVTGDEDGTGEADLTDTGLYFNNGDMTDGWISAETLEEDYTASRGVDLTEFKKDWILGGAKSPDAVPDEILFENKMDENNLIKLDDNSEFYITYADIDYDRVNGAVYGLLLKGYYIGRD